MAAPIRDHSGQILCGVGISGPSYRLTEKVAQRLAPAVVTAAENLGADVISPNWWS
jgi:DNA-binding IclR family transcriptional regulator